MVVVRKEARACLVVILLLEFKREREAPANLAESGTDRSAQAWTPWALTDWRA